MTPEDKVNEALRSMIPDALSGRPASTIVLDDAMNDAFGSMLHASFFEKSIVLQSGHYACTLHPPCLSSRAPEIIFRSSEGWAARTGEI